jgi:Anticodon-binding domain of tRNA ligase
MMPRGALEALVLLLSPFAPHIAEELWQKLGHEESLAYHPWPEHDPAALIEETVEVAVQINGKVRDRFTVPAGAAEEEESAAPRGEALGPLPEGGGGGMPHAPDGHGGLDPQRAHAPMAGLGDPPAPLALARVPLAGHPAEVGLDLMGRREPAGVIAIPFPRAGSIRGYTPAP